MAFKSEEARKAYDKKWSRKNMARRVELNNRWKKKVYTWFEGYKKTLKCARCTENDPCCLDFHHINPKEKDLSVSVAVYRKGWSIKRVLTEVSKCIILCANCHRKEHAAVA